MVLGQNVNMLSSCHIDGIMIDPVILSLIAKFCSLLLMFFCACTWIYMYLHQLKDTAERIKAVDRAASMVEDILKQGQTLLPVTTTFHSAMSNGQVCFQY